MAFTRKPQTYSSSINEVTIGTGDKAVTIGGSNVMPLYSFDAPLKNKVAIGAEITDSGVDRTLPGIASYYEGAETIAEIAKRAAEMPGADFVALALNGADPNGDNRSVEECVEIAKQVSDAIDVPLVITGSRNVEKDTALFSSIAEALQGKNVLLVSAKEENYKTVAASAIMAYGNKISAESAVDINLAKQLNVLLSQMGINPESYVMNVGTAAAGYGYDYVASTLDRVKDAALAQNDAMLQMPIITPVSQETWTVKESIVSEEDFPDWGSRESRGVDMEVCTAAAVIAGGADAVILRHPQSIEAISNMIADLM
ncbi:MAG: acetyl-CoA decarbonylase/synthase complex subunit delta [Oscillospiraceae bacterium]|jgi:acetyl-CoA decarbonylase/synthase complex subunit delta|nr:acetyl-CoA decarbonylase/synthase complex subunit delta [Oscillospiraceae bacterium]MBQ5341493.1 acetyl-CoA decarbonylase/synthase complex subunit delta [Oscillospiraceae bacterium]